MVVPPPFSQFSKLCLPVPANWPGDETLKTLKMVVTPSFSKFSKFSPGTLAGGWNFENFENVKFKVFKVGPSARVRVRHFELFENGGTPRRVQRVQSWSFGPGHNR
jgi:hypothetical protein